MKVLFELPLQFLACCLAILTGVYVGWRHRHQAWGLPVIAVLGTVTVWYIVDVFYNDYDEYLFKLGPEALDAAWWQVLIFLIGFLGMVPVIHGVVNFDVRHRGSMMMRYFETRRLEHPEVQRRITKAASGLFLAWVLLMTCALIRTRGDFIGLFAPYLGERADPWGRNRVGGGFDAIIALAAYVQLFITAGAGVIAAVSRDPATRRKAIVICVLTLPFYIFDRTRNTMLSSVLPGLLAWVFLRLRGGMIVKIAVLAGAFMVVNLWFSFVIANRGSGRSIAQVTAVEGVRSEAEGRHDGLNMLEELGWINHLTATGAYQPNMGSRYFAEFVNPIPRVIWKNKPEIGIDYAIARGQGGNDASAGGVYATISTGMIGQGVVNFGGLFGPLAAALLVSLWVSLLARQDLLGADPARLLLFAIGMILTFNIGRDITLLVLYPFLFGLLLLKAWYYLRGDEAEMLRDVRPARRKARRKRLQAVGEPEWRKAAPAPSETSHD